MLRAPCGHSCETCTPIAAIFFSRLLPQPSQTPVSLQMRCVMTPKSPGAISALPAGEQSTRRDAGLSSRECP
jgi:hypothetical protein